MSVLLTKYKTKDSIGYKLLRIVFSFYVLVAIIITAFHMYSEYDNAKNNIFKDMKSVEISFKKQLANSIWNYNDELIFEVIDGILSNRTILGITIKDDKNKIIANKGRIDILKQNNNELYIHNFDLKTQNYNNGNLFGSVSLYSDKSIIYDSVKNNFQLIVINSLIKTLALWIIFLYFSKIFITKPFFEVVQTVAKLDLDKLEKIYLSKKHKNSEFEILENAFNAMIEKLQSSYNKLNNANNQNIKLNQELESRVDERTKDLKASNIELEQLIKVLKDAQEQLVQAEKLASLGSLVAGVAHEINTPVGTSFTAITHLETQVINLENSYKQETLSQEELEEFLDTAKIITNSIKNNLHHTSEIIRSFKNISVDVSNEEIKEFYLKEYINEIVISLTNELKRKHIKLDINCDNKMLVKTFPVYIYQIFSNLILNSVIHGFINKDKYSISINIKKDGNRIVIDYIDDGIGISKKNIDKIFEPFFTTNRSHGGTGLGLNIIYNLITAKMSGKISCTSEENSGVHFIIEFHTND